MEITIPGQLSDCNFQHLLNFSEINSYFGKIKTPKLNHKAIFGMSVVSSNPSIT